MSHHEEAELDSLYRSVIMEHYRSPCNRRSVEGAQITAEGKNALCGDELRLELKVKDGRVEDAGFTGQGCAISMAAASMLTDRLTGIPLEEANRLIRIFTRFVKGEGEEGDETMLEDLAVFEGVSKFPVRIKCALLPFTALAGSLETESPK
jgi:nitrogen fixation NifU-like protein